jgi:hypothetical protein
MKDPIRKMSTVARLVRSALVVGITSPILAQANQESLCEQRLAECLFRPSHEVGGCLAKTSTEPFCKTSHVAELTSERASLGRTATINGITNGTESEHGAVQHDCLQKFDLALSSRIINEDLSSEALAVLRSQLTTCVSPLAPDVRP